MTIEEFAHDFLPLLINEYIKGDLPFHGLVDIETWKKVFPDADGSNSFHWYEIAFTCNKLQDGTLLLTFILPQPTQPGQPKFSSLRFDPNDKDNKQINYYVLRKPGNILDSWDIVWLSSNEGEINRELKYLKKIDGTDSLRNFIFSVQQSSFKDEEDETSVFDSIKNFIIGAISQK